MDSDNRPTKSDGVSEAKSPLLVKDWVGFAFSALALCVSALSYYTSNVRVEDHAFSRIVDTSVEAGDADDPRNGYRHGFVVLHVAFVNAGNLPAIVTDCTYQLSDRPDLTNGGFGDAVDVEPKVFPMLIAAHDIRLNNLKIPIRKVISSYSSGAKVHFKTGTSHGAGKTGGLRSASSETEDLRRFYAGLSYRAVDSSGKIHDALSGMQVIIEVKPTTWAALGHVGADRDFPLVPLF